MFGRFLRERREAAGLSLYRLAKLTGISAQQLSNYESGRSEPTVSKAETICRVLGVRYCLGRRRG